MYNWLGQKRDGWAYAIKFVHWLCWCLCCNGLGSSIMTHTQTVVTFIQPLLIPYQPIAVTSGWTFHLNHLFHHTWLLNFTAVLCVFHLYALFLEVSSCPNWTYFLLNRGLIFLEMAPRLYALSSLLSHSTKWADFFLEMDSERWICTVWG